MFGNEGDRPYLLKASPSTLAAMSFAIGELKRLIKEQVLAILNATVDIWHSSYTDQHGLGAIDKGAWTSSIDYMKTLPDLGVSSSLTADLLLTEDLLP